MSGPWVLHYHRTHLPSGAEHVAAFNASHVWVFTDPAGIAWRTLMSAAQACIEKWNRDQPDTWRYRLASDEEAAHPGYLTSRCPGRTLEP